MESVTQVPSAIDENGVEDESGAGLRRAEIVRLALIGGCIATAALADLEGNALPWSKIVAVGAALLGGLLVFRRPPLAARIEPSDEEYAAVKQPGRIGRRRSQAEQRLDLAIGRISELDERVAELSRRQTVLRVMARDGLAVVEQRLDALDAAVADTDERTRQETERLRDLLAQLAERLLDATATKRPV